MKSKTILSKQFVIIIIPFLLALSACVHDKINPLMSTANDFSDILAKASPDFRQGWLDGCEAGMHTSATNFYRMFYHANKIDGYKMINSPDYGTAWNAAEMYCQTKTYIDQKRSIFGSMFTGVN